MRRKSLIRENKYLTEALSSQILVTLLCISNLQRSTGSPSALEKTFLIIAGIVTILNMLYIFGGRFISLIDISEDRRRRRKRRKNRKGRKDTSAPTEPAEESQIPEEKPEGNAECCT